MSRDRKQQGASLVSEDPAASARPQTLLLTLLGRHVHRRAMAVAASTFIAALARLGVSEGAARSTLTRMVRRGFLERHRVGRETYFSITPWTDRVLAEGEPRIFEFPIRQPDAAQEWTLLSFSIPEVQRSDRHNLRTALSWRGFGRLRNGLWLAPGRVDVTDMIAERGLSDRTDVFVGQPIAPSDVDRIVAECWDLEQLGDGYRGFIDRWRRRGEPDSALADQVRLITDWRLLLLDDPQLPVDRLPEAWPAEEAYTLFRQRHHELSEPAATEFEELLRCIDVCAPSAAS